MTGVTTRLVAVADAPELAAVLTANREFLAPWDPVRGDDYYTAEGQRAHLEEVLRLWATGTALPQVILDDGRIVGRVNLSNVVRGPFQSANLGYWVAQDANGRGVATAAVARTARTAFDDLGLHRLEAGTLVHNLGSQRVLERNGFQRYGLAPRYLRIAGEWQDHILYQLLAD
ncbi:GNAT family N-acetyltransferase [Paractinoplanes rishiriensis]|uniref:Ribosomal-protein-alanine N-acetyltransferase n=1 Tax=Paractinoplanes rishiriensis TaxID=1050105 RepID=A0A919JRX6_9ACTN|nr:GNAT family N-acetyltransferase [Actinoplanes rishiriensis]GIE93735.1 ribosomal-protein-alanine N-acetyltransferase [Actinoplanes rishiriensis]